MSQGTIISVNIATEKGTPKQAVPEIQLTEQGVAQDAHAGPWHRQVSLLSAEDIAGFAARMDRTIGPGEFAENLTTEGLDLGRVAVLDRLRCGETLLEVTQIGKACHGEGCAIFREVGKCVMPKQGIFTRVLETGTIRPGDTIEHLERPLRILVLTLSDRAAAGVYGDRSGPKAAACLEDHFRDSRWHPALERRILPDDAEPLRAELRQAVADGVDIILTLGGTGLGPRDTAPETVAAVCDKTFTGVMDAIRLKYGTDIPAALLSRSIAGLAGTTLIYALPGSPRAVEQYLQEILRTLEHSLGMVHGLDWH